MLQAFQYGAFGKCYISYKCYVGLPPVCNFIKNRILHSCYPPRFSKFLRTRILWNTSVWDFANITLSFQPILAHCDNLRKRMIFLVLLVCKTAGVTQIHLNFWKLLDFDRYIIGESFIRARQVYRKLFTGLQIIATSKYAK